MTILQLRLLGTFAVQRDDLLLTRFRSDKVRALLAYLAVEGDRAHARSSLAALFWPDQSDDLALNNLSQTLRRLREAIGDAQAEPSFLLATRQSVQWNPRSSTELDVISFTRLGGSTEVTDLEAAAALYMGSFLDGFYLEECQEFDEWMAIIREQLERLALEVNAALATAYLSTHAYGVAEVAARRQLVLDPWRETAHRQVMEALAGAGQRTGALAQFARLRQLLEDELGVEPDSETQALHARLLAGDFVQATNGAAPRHNLPVALSPCVGREAELRVLAAFRQQKDVHLLTLIGAGGMGKTRLALEVAYASLDTYADGVYFVALAPLSAAAAVGSAIIRALGVSLPGSDPTEALLRWIRDKHLLLILDNFEHLLGGVPQVVELLQAAPQLQIIVTSREPLNVRGEQIYAIGGLEYGQGALPAVVESSSAIRLFVQVARRVLPGFRLRDAELPALRRICELVGGMPLGLELAASWVSILPLEEIAREMTRDVDFLAADWSDAPDRHRSMRGVFDWSWRLLGPTERQVLSQLSVFRGGFTREAAEAIAGATLRVLASLHRKSLLQLRPVHGVMGRYEIHELVRQFAAEQLQAVPDELGDRTRQRHAAYYLRLANEAAPELAGGPEQIIWFGRIAAEFDNFRAVLDWAMEQKEVAIVLRLGTALREFWMTRGYLDEGRQWLEAALTLDDQASESVSNVLRGSALTTAGWLAANGRDFTAAEQLFEQSLSLARRGEEPQQIIAVLGDLGQAARMQKDFVRAVELYEERVMLARELGDARGLAWALCNLGMIAYEEGNLRVEPMLEEGVAVARSIGDQVCVAWCLTFLARVAKDRGKYARSRAIFAQALKVFRDLGHADGIAYTLEGWAGLAATRGDFRSAARLFGAAEALREVINRRQPPDHFDLAGADAVAGGARWQADWAEGRMLSVEQAMVVALAQNED